MTTFNDEQNFVSETFTLKGWLNWLGDLSEKDRKKAHKIVYRVI